MKRVGILSVVFAAGVAVTTATFGQSTETLDDRNAAIMEHANEILTQLKAVRSRLTTGGEKPRLAIMPLVEDEEGLNQQVLDDLSARLLKALIDKSAGVHHILTRDAIHNRIKHIGETATLPRHEASKRIGALLQEAEKIDVLIRGQVWWQERRILLHFTGVGRNGGVVVTTLPRAIPLTSRETSPTPADLSLELALSQAARTLVEKTAPLKTVWLAGIHHQNCGTQTRFGRFLREQIEHKLREAGRHPVSGEELLVKPLRVDVRSPAGLRGIGIVPTGAPPAAAPEHAAEDGAKTLTGTYWLHPDSVTLTLKLLDVAGGGATWSGRIRRASLERSRLLSGKCRYRLREGDGVGPFEFTLLSDRGRDPAYHLGEDVSLVFTTGIDAWIYCFNVQADDEVIQVLPNPYSWRKPESLKFAASKTYHVPAADTFPFALKVQRPLGVDLIKCFATSRDVTARLPEAMRGRSLEPLPAELAADLAAPFRRLQEVKVSEASLAVTIIE